MACVLSASVVGCSLLVDVGGLTGGAARDAGVASDVGVVADSATAEDATGSLDATTPRDGAHASTRFCERGTHLFCSDFEEPALAGGPDAEWNTVEIMAGGAVERTTLRAREGVGSLHVTTPGRMGDAPSYRSVVRRVIEGPWQKVRLEYDVHWQRPAWSGGSENGCLSSILLGGTGQSKVGFYAFRNRSVDAVSIDRPSGLHGVGSALPYLEDQWSHVVVTLDVVSASSSATYVTEGGTTTVPFTLDSNVSRTPGSPFLQLEVGLFVPNAPVPAFEAWFDDVVLDAVP